MRSTLPCMLSLLFYHKQYICQSTEEPSGGSASRACPAINLLKKTPTWHFTPVKYNTECCKCRAFFFLFVPLYNWIFVLPLTGDCLCCCQRLGWVLWFFQIQEWQTKGCIMRNHDCREKIQSTPLKKYFRSPSLEWMAWRWVRSSIWSKKNRNGKKKSELREVQCGMFSVL